MAVQTTRTRRTAKPRGITGDIVGIRARLRNVIRAVRGGKGFVPGMRRFRLTLLFVIVSTVVMGTATVVVNRLLGDLARDNLIRIAEENTARDGLHIQSMMRGSRALQDTQRPTELTLEFALRELSTNPRQYIEALNIAKLNLFDLAGNAVWSTDPGTVGTVIRDSLPFAKAVAGGISSELVENHAVVHLDGVSRLTDAVETYLPLRDTPSGEIIGVLEIYRDVAVDLAVQVNDARWVVLRTTTATMGGLFVALLGFVVMADITISRSNRRELSLAKEKLAERKRAEEALEDQARELAHSNEELQQFAYGASHDLQEPLRKIRAFGDLLAIECGDALSDSGRDYISRMQDAAGRMQTLINDLLTLSRVMTNARPFVPVDLNALMREVLSDLEVRIEESGGRVEVGDLPTVDADPVQMRQLLQNLVGNALKFHRQGRSPTVKVHGRIVGGNGDHSGDRMCEIVVEDDGIGFDEKYRDQIFAVFRRLHGRGTYDGTGIGLATCRKIVARHNGTIAASSRPGEGATFVITLPVSQST